MSDYYLQDDDVSKLELDDSSGFLILDDEGAVASRITQVPVETAVLPTDHKGRITQVPVEVVMEGDPLARITQVAVEVAQRNLHESITVVIWE